MEKFIARLVKDFEDKKVSRRHPIHTIQVAAATFVAGEQAANAAPAKAFKTINVNHISYSCPDYTIARDFYQHLMGMGVSQDNGQQCYMHFGPNQGAGPGTFLLPRGYPQPPATYTTSGTVSAPRTPRGGAQGENGAGAGRGAAAGAGRGGANNNAQQAQQPQVTI